jgi:hypothetical protein
MKGSEKLKILKLSDEVYEHYKSNIKGNENITKDQAARKLTRNVMLAMEITPRNALDRLKGNKLYYYGNLHILVRRGKVVHLSNHYGGKHFGGWFKDEKRYVQLTKELGIID